MFSFPPNILKTLSCQPSLQYSLLPVLFYFVWFRYKVGFIPSKSLFCQKKKNSTCRRNEGHKYKITNWPVIHECSHIFLLLFLPGFEAACLATKQHSFQCYLGLSSFPLPLCCGNVNLHCHGATGCDLMCLQFCSLKSKNRVSKRGSLINSCLPAAGSVSSSKHTGPGGGALERGGRVVALSLVMGDSLFCPQSSALF